MEIPHSLNIPGYTIEVLRTSYPDVYAVILDGIFYKVVLNAIGTPGGFESMGESQVSLADMRGWRIRNDDQVPFGVYRAIRDILQSKPGTSAPRPPMIGVKKTAQDPEGLEIISVDHDGYGVIIHGRYFEVYTPERIAYQQRENPGDAYWENAEPGKMYDRGWLAEGTRSDYERALARGRLNVARVHLDQLPDDIRASVEATMRSQKGNPSDPRPPRPPMIGSRRFIAQQVIEDAVEYNIQAKPEDEDFRGNASAIDPETDRQVEEDIARRLDQGDIWAWCNVEVSAKYEDPNTQKPYYGYAYLGGCSYSDEDDFKAPGGYYDDMKAEALEDLKGQLEDSGVDLVRPPLWG